MAYNGGYSETMSQAIRNVNLPERLRCTEGRICGGKWKGQHNFSNKQLLDLKYHIRTHGQASIRNFKLRCRECTPQQVTELPCHGFCGEVKELAAFSKNMRHNPLKAECIKCVNERLELEPEYDLKDGGSDSDDSDTCAPPDDSDDDDDFSVGLTTDSMSGLTLSSGNDDTTSVTSCTSWNTSSTVSGGVSLSSKNELLIAGWSTQSVNKGSITTSSSGYCSSSGGVGVNGSSKSGSSTPAPVKNGWDNENDGWSTPKRITPTAGGFDPYNYGHPATKKSVASVAGSTASRSTAATTTASTGESGWARVRAYKPPVQVPVDDDDDDKNDWNGRPDSDSDDHNEDSDEE